MNAGRLIPQRLRNQAGVILCIGIGVVFFTAGGVWEWCNADALQLSSTVGMVFLRSVTLGFFSVGGIIVGIGLHLLVHQVPLSGERTAQQAKLVRILCPAVIGVSIFAGILALVGIVVSIMLQR